jgi:hypothetical protein
VDALAPGEIDVLAQVAPMHDLRPNVDWDGAQLTIRADNGSTHVRVPIVAPGTAVPVEYDLIVRLVRQPKLDKQRGLGFAIHFPLPGDRHGEAYLDGFYGSGLSGIDGKDYKHPATHFTRRLFRNGVESEIVCSVRKDGITVAVDGAPWIQWKGDFTCFPTWPSDRTPQLAGITAHSARFVVTAMRMRPVATTAAENEVSPR